MAIKRFGDYRFGDDEKGVDVIPKKRPAGDGMVRQKKRGQWEARIAEEKAKLKEGAE